MNQLEKNKSGVYKYLKEILENLKSKKTKKEVEFKVILDGDKNEIKEKHKNLQKKILKELSGKVIFNGTIEDTRYYDTKNKDTSILNENNISMIRVRNQKAKYGRKEENIYTVKQRIGNSTESGYEENEYEDENIGKDFGEKVLEKNYSLQKIKISRKTRKELKFEVEINGKKEEVKVAFDEYLPRQNGDENIFEDNSDILPFFEIEAETREIANKGLEELEKIFPEIKNSKITFKGAKGMKEQDEREELVEKLKNNNNKIYGLRGKIVNSIVDLLKNQTIYKTYSEFFEDIENNKEFLYNKELRDDFRKLLEDELNKQIKNPIFERFFHRIITNKTPGNDPRKKFFDKFEREYSGYIKSFLNVIAYDFQEKTKNDKSGIDNSRILKNIILEKLDVFLKSLFLFNDSLTKEELERVLKEDSDKIRQEFNSFSENINKIYIEENLENVPKIWEGYSLVEKEEGKKEKGEEKIKEEHKIDNKRVLNSLITSYSRAYASVVQKGGEIGNKEAIEEKQESIEKEQFAFLSRQFSAWLNSPNRELSTFDTIKNLLKEDFYHIFLLAKKGFAFRELYSEGDEFNQNFINKVAKKYESILFNKNNFQVKEKCSELFSKFVESLFLDSDKVSGKIIKDFKKYNKKHNIDVLKEYNEVDNIYGFTEKNINFDFWKKLRVEPRMYLFLNKVLNIKNGVISFKKDFLFGNKGNFKKIKKDFLKYEFDKNNKNLSDRKYKEKFKTYQTIVNKQFNYLSKYLSENKIQNLDINGIKNLVRNNVNNFQLLVSWFQYNLKLFKVKKHNNANNNEKILVEELSLHSESFAEKVLTKIPDDILQDEELEFITSTSSAYNTSVTDNKRIIELHDRIGNDKSIDVSDNFYFEKGGNKYLMKDFTNLYLPKEKNINYDDNRLFLEDGIETVRNLLNGDKPEKNDQYCKILKNINFPISDSKSLKKLLEFQKLIYKITLPVANKLYKKADDNTNKFATKIYTNIKHDKQKDHYVANPKNYSRTVEKVITKYGGNIEQLADGTRATVYGDNLEDLGDKIIDLVKFAKNNGEIKSIRFEDKIGNLFKKAIRPNGYRDATLAITNEDGTTVEIQFHLKQFYAIKTGDIKIDENKLLNLDGEKGFKIKDFDIGEKLGYEKIKFSEEEKDILIKYCITTNTKIPQSFANLFDIKNKEIIDNDLKFNADYTYNLERTLGLLDSGINDKLKVLDRILFNIANGEVAAIELERIMNIFETKK